MAQNKPTKKSIVAVSLVMALCLLGNEMLFIVLPLYWQSFGLTALWQVGVLLSVNRFIRILINPLIALFYKKVSTRTGIFIAALLAVISTFAYGYLKGIWLLFLARCLWGISWSLFRLGGYLIVISSSTTKTRGEYMGLFNGLWGLGTLTGMLFGGVLTEMIGLKNVTTLFAFIGLVSFPLIYKFIPNLNTSLDTNKIKKTSIWKSDKIILSLITGLVISFSIYGVFSSTLSNLVKHQMTSTLTLFGLSFGAASLAGFIQACRTGWDPFLAPLFGRLTDRTWDRDKVLIGGLLLATLCYIVVPLELPIPLFILLIFLFQLTATLLITSIDSTAANLATGNIQIQVVSFYTLFSDLGAALGALIAFILIDFFGIIGLYWTTGLLLFLLTIPWIRSYQKRKLLKQA